MTFHVPNHYRVRTGALASDDSIGNAGAFDVAPVIGNRRLMVIASDGLGWEHVSVHVDENGRSRIPTWREMCFIKVIFWSPNDWVVQFHPDEREYVNCHPDTLHLWRPTNATMPTPDSILVGPKTAGGKR